MSLNVRFKVDLPEGVTATDEEVLAWLRFNLGENGELRLSNPLSDYEVEAKPFSVCVD